MTPAARASLVRGLAACGAVLLAVAPSTALAHAELIDSVPSRAARLEAAPGELAMTFTEPPAGDARVTVTDGCDRDVAEGVAAHGQRLDVELVRGQPGSWEVTYAVISAVDGHATDGSFSFRVMGEADCTKLGSEDDAPDVAGDRDDDGLPIVPFAIAGAALIAIAVATRMISSRP